MSWIVEAIINELLNYDIKPIENIYNYSYYGGLMLITGKHSFNYLAIGKYFDIYPTSNLKYYEFAPNVNLNDIEQIILSIFRNVHLNSNKNLNKNSNIKINILAFLFQKKNEIIYVDLMEDYENIIEVSEFFKKYHSIETYEYSNLNQINLSNDYVILLIT